MEVAGLVLGAIPIVLKGIDVYIEIYGEWAKEAELLAKRRRQLNIEHLKLKQSLQSLSPDLIEEEVNENLLLFYPDDYKTIVGTIDDLRQAIWRLREQLDIDMEGKPLSTSRVHDGWRRIKRSLKKRDTKELFDEIARYNTNLSICFEGKREISSDLKTRSSMQLQSFNKRVCQKLRNDACLIHEALSEAYDRECTNVHLNMIDLSWHHQGFRISQIPDLYFPDRDSCAQAPRHWRTAKIRLEPIQSPAPVDKVDVSKTHLTTEKASGKKLHKARFDISFGRSSRSPSPMPEKMSVQPTTAAPPPLREQIHSICSSPATKLFGGYLQNSDPDNQNMIILERKQHSPKQVCVLSWRDLLTGSAGTRSYAEKKKMSRKDSLAIASAATWAVLLLCGTPWLEENQTMEDSIVLLAETSSPELENANAVPAFSYRFAQPGPEATPTHDADPMGSSNAIAHRTLFALAILLLEIGLDADFPHLCATSAGGGAFGGFGAAASRLEGFRVAERAVEDRLYDEMGDAYADAAKRCLRFHFAGRQRLQRFANEGMRQEFFAAVVAPVHARYEQEESRHRVFRSG